MKNSRRLHALILVAATLFGYGVPAPAQNTNAKISDTKHNLSANGPGTVKSGGTASATTVVTDQICVFCHTPHAAEAVSSGPLWNRTLKDQTYSRYTSNSLDAEDILGTFIENPGGASKLCLSCHDGTIAIGAVANSPGSGTDKTISMVGTTADGKMPTTDAANNANTTTGYTRNLGIDLTNDHPISFTFQDPPPAATTDTLSQRDGELRTPGYQATNKDGKLQTVVGIRSTGVKPMLPLDHEGKVQCTSCHDPHLTASKFLRLNRLQQTSSAGTTFAPAKDQICLGCHDKNKDRSGTAYLAWSNSAHGNSSIATYKYKDTAASQREFATGTMVWEAACLNCHDTHTVQGSRRLLREGTDSTSSPKAGGNPAIEETCFQCHNTATASILQSGTGTVPDIKSEFGRGKSMPIVSGDQAGDAEVHDIGGNFNDTYNDCTTTTNKCGADFIEDRAKLGAGALSNRHAECTDCHNPHRVMRDSLFNGTGSGTARTHTHTSSTQHSNIASGPLRGTWGVEPTYGTLTTWPQKPTYEVKRGDPGAGATTERTKPYLTREYQLCFKCHSDFAYTDNNTYGSGDKASSTTDTKGSTSGRPALGSFTGGTASSTNNMSYYTNQAAEWAVGANDTLSGTDQKESGTTPTNHRSWHPVTYPTGRTLSERTISGTSPWIAPFATGTGDLTMYCSDCHGSKTSGAAQGPHGSENNFLLKGDWKRQTGESYSGDLCFNCHVFAVYAGSNVDDDRTGFCCDEKNNLHTHHQSSRANGMDWRCTYCHVAVPHGWKNKAFLVNLNDLGREAGFDTSTAANATSSGADNVYNNPPYYMGAKLRVTTWQRSGAWTKGSCTGESWMQNSCGGN